MYFKMIVTYDMRKNLENKIKKRKRVAGARKQGNHELFLYSFIFFIKAMTDELLASLMMLNESMHSSTSIFIVVGNDCSTMDNPVDGV